MFQELAQVMDRHIHEPHLMTDEQQVRAGCRICVEYPEPIVDHKQAAKTTSCWEKLRP